MTREELIQVLQLLLAETSVEELRAVLTEVAGGTPVMPVNDPILEPYREMLDKEAAAIQKLRGVIGSKEPSKAQQKMLDAYDALVTYFDRLVAAGGDVSKAGEIPRVQWTAATGFTSGWLGKDVRARVKVFVNGQPFIAIPGSSFIHDARAILDGCTDPSGTYWQPYNVVGGKTFPCWNQCEMTDSYKPTADDDDLDLIRNFDLSKGQLRSNPKNWPEPFKAAWFEGHPDYVFQG
jgi:hypothetical protein